MTDLNDEVAVITGSGAGLGAAMGHAFARAGAAVAVLDIDSATGERTASENNERHGVRTTHARVDVGSASSIEDADGHVAEMLGGCDVLAADVAYIVTHGSVRADYLQRHEDLTAALDRMELS